MRGMFDQATATAIAERIATGEPLEAICRTLPQAPTSRTVRRWIESEPTLASDIAHARDIGYDAIAWRAREIARGKTDAGSSGDVARDRLIVETDLKLLAKWDPKRYGDRIHQDVDMTVRVQIADPTRQLRQAQPVATQSPPTLPALEHSGPVSALAAGALVRPGNVTQK